MSDLVKLRKVIEDCPENFITSFIWGAKDVIQLEGFGLAQLVEARGIDNCDGETIWIVFSLNDHLYRLTGYYDTIHGEEDWSEDYGSTLTEVVPMEKKIRIYNDVV